jgi:hypothetical protein
MQSTSKLDDSLNQLDLLGVLMLQGVLVNRALKLVYEQKEAEEKSKSPLLLPHV